MDALNNIIASISMPSRVRKDPFDFTDPVYDAEVKKAVKTVEEAKSFGWKTATVLASSEELADRLESLMQATKQFTYTRNKCYFELTWTDAPVVQGQAHVPEPVVISQEEMEIMGLMMQNLDFSW